MDYASFGSISSGTMCAIDLVDTFASELQCLINNNRAEFEADSSRADRMELPDRAQAWAALDENSRDEDEGDSLVEELFDALQEFAPPYAYFGALPGDGADYGFWLSEEFEHDFDGLKIDDWRDIPIDYVGEIAFISDHGNVTFGYTTEKRSEGFIEVWSIV